MLPGVKRGPEWASSRYLTRPSSFALLFSTELLLLVMSWMFVALTAQMTGLTLLPSDSSAELLN